MLGAASFVKGECRAWIQDGKCPRGDSCSYSHPPGKKVTPSDRRLSRSPGKKGKGKGKSKSRETSRERSQKDPTGTSPSGKLARPVCCNWLKGACNNAQRDFWHSPACRFFSKNTCEAGDKCKFQHVRPKAAANADANIDINSDHKQNEAKPKPKVKGQAKAGAVLSIPLLVAASMMGEAHSMFVPHLPNHMSHSSKSNNMHTYY